MIDRRMVVRGGLAGAGAMALAGWPAAALAAAGDDPYLRLVHPELRRFGAMLLEMGASRPPLSPATLAATRADMGRFSRPVRGDVPVARRTVPVPGGPAVPIIIVNAAAGASRPAILHIHGGGFVLGTAETGVRDLQDLCAELGCVAVSVDYRLAPETTWRGSLEDNYAGLKWLHANAAAIGGDPARIALLGESAGGGHAAMLAIAARDRGEVPVAFQCLVYPMLDDRTGSSVTAPAHHGRILWTPAANRYGWQSLLGMAPGGAGVPAGPVPARVENLAGLPPAFIGVGTLDLFLDEDITYARRLNDAGVPAELVVVPGAFHGFDMAGAMDPGVQVAARFNAAKKAALRQGLAAG